MRKLRLCPDSLHVGPNPLSMRGFYANSRMKNGHSTYCRKCTKRQATANRERREGSKRADECRDPNHVDIGPLSAGDFYQNTGRVCIPCHKRRSAVGNRAIQAAMRDKKAALGLVHSRRLEETPDEHDRKLRALDVKYSVHPELHRERRRESPFEPPPSFSDLISKLHRAPTLRHRNGRGDTELPEQGSLVTLK